MLLYDGFFFFFAGESVSTVKGSTAFSGDDIFVGSPAVDAEGSITSFESVSTLPDDGSATGTAAVASGSPPLPPVLVAGTFFGFNEAQHLEQQSPVASLPCERSHDWLGARESGVSDSQKIKRSTRCQFLTIGKRLTKKPQPILHGFGSAGLFASGLLLIAPSSCILQDNKGCGGVVSRVARENQFF
jgi:hypothetical protein